MPPSKETSTTPSGQVEGALEGGPQAGLRSVRSTRRSIEHVDPVVPAPCLEHRQGLEARGLAVDTRALEAQGHRRHELGLEGSLAPARHGGEQRHRGAREAGEGGSRRSPGHSGSRWARSSAGNGAGPPPRRARAGSRRSRSPSPPWSGGGSRSCAGRWRWRGTGR